MCMQTLRSKRVEIHTIAYKAIVLNILQFEAGLLGCINVSQRKKFENCQRLMLTCILNKCLKTEGKSNDVTLFLTKIADKTIKKFDKSFEDNDISYQEKLAETELYHITHRFDRNFTILTGEATIKQLCFPEINLKLERSG